MLNIDTTYPGQTAGVTANYPSGEARNVTSSGAGDGTPWELQIVNDMRGFAEKVVKDAPITINGAPDTALASDVLDGLQLLLLNRSELVTEGGNILVTGDRLPNQHRDGGAATWDSSVLLTTAAGSWRDLADDSDLILTSSLQKQINATWVSGAGGGLPDALALAADTWYLMFVVAKPDGSTDLVWDTSPTAANFFADANAIAAGFSDSSLFRRIRKTLSNSAGTGIVKFWNHAEDPTRYQWDVPIEVKLGAVSSAARTAVDLSPGVPPDSYGLVNVRVQWASPVDNEVLITSSVQTDTPVTVAIWTLQTNASDDALIRGQWFTDTNSQIFIRRGAATAVSGASFQIDGWVDKALD